MGSRHRRSPPRSLPVFLGLVLAFAGIASIAGSLRSLSWVFFLAGCAVGVAWLLSRPPGVVPMEAALAPARAPAPSPLHTVPTLRGERVRCRAEARIADHLHRRGISYQYEAPVAGYCADFYVPAWGLVIEYWGIDTPEYRERRRAKTRAYHAAGHRLVGLEPTDWADLEQVLARRLGPFEARRDERAELPA